MQKLNKRELPIQKSHRRFRFADSTYNSLGAVKLPLQTPPGIPVINVLLDIVPADIPALLGLDVLDAESLMVDTVTNRLWKRLITSADNDELSYIDMWHVPLLRNDDHVYAEMALAKIIFYTRTQLSKLHRQFMHPPSDRLFKLLRRARPDDLPQDTLRTLEDISRRCEPCQKIQRAPTRFRVSFGAEDCRFNERVMMDIMYLDGNPVLHIVDEGTHFSAARFLPDSSTKTIWQTFLTCWAAIYTGLPHKILVDQGSAFGRMFNTVGALRHIEIQETGIEAHSSLGLGERYHEPLRTTYRKLKVAYPSVGPEFLLSCTVKAMNATLGPEGLVPSALVFGEYPSVRTISEPLQERPTLSSRAEIATAARQEMSQIMAKQRVERGLRHRVPTAAYRTHAPGEKVLVWREKIHANRIGEWLGPFTVDAVDVDHKLVLVRDVAIGPAKPFNLAQVKPYNSPEKAVDSFFSELSSVLKELKSPDEYIIRLTEVLEKDDPRVDTPEMRSARFKEIQGLIERGTFDVILKKDLPENANLMPARFVFALKSTEDGKVKCKARYVICGNRDKLKDMMVHTSTTVQASSSRLLLALALNVWSADVTQAYLQSSTPLMRDVYIRNPALDFDLGPDEILQLVKPLYGLSESGDIWHETLDKHLRDDLNMKPMKSDPGLYTLKENGRLVGLNANYVDDLLRAGSEIFRAKCRQTHDKFEMKDEEDPPFLFAGFKISGDKKTGYELDQDHYLKKLEELPKDAPLPDFRSMRMKLAWIGFSRPDCGFEISQLAQVTDDLFNGTPKEHINRLNKAIRYAVSNPVSISFPNLDHRTLRVIGFSDASFAGNADLTSQLGYIIFLTDDSGQAIPIHFRSYKSRRVTRSVMAAEVIAFSDMFDCAFTLGHELSQMFDRKIPIVLLTDSKSLFDVISKGTRTSEKRTMIDISAARKGYHNHDISDIGHVSGTKNIADGLTKRMHQAALLNVLRTGKLDLEVAQWIIRDAG